MKHSGPDSTINKFFKGIYNGINDIVIVINEKVEIRKINHAAENILLYSNEELNNCSLGKLIQKNDFDIVRDSIRNVYKKNLTQEIALNLVAKNKKIVPVSCSFSPLIDEKGQLTDVLLMAKDLNTIIGAQKQISDKNDEMNFFVYKASHDLKSPVSSIKGLMNLVKKSETIKDAKMYHSMIDEGINKLETVINDLMILGKVTYDEIVYETINTKILINDILRSIQFSEGFSDIKFSIDIEPKAAKIETEKGLLTAMLYNLIDNAVKYRQKRQEPSYVNIKVRSSTKSITLNISDNGVGIKESHQPNILKMFYRANEEIKGSGLGLYIVKMGAIKLGGQLTFKSTWKQGSTFNILLPVKKGSPSKGKLENETYKL